MNWMIRREAKAAMGVPGADLTGQRFGMLTALEKVKLGHSKYKWKCKCDCGNMTYVRTGHLTSGNIKSCGCNHFKACVTHGMANTRLYHIWCTMKARCNRPTSGKYDRYGGRGIKLCDEWQRFEPFYEWAVSNGYSEELSIDRIDNDGNYEPDNCRWVKNKVQANNTSRVKRLTYQGVTHTYSEWSEITGIPHKVISKRIYKGWSVEDALSIEIGKYSGGRGRGHLSSGH